MFLPSYSNSTPSGLFTNGCRYGELQHENSVRNTWIFMLEDRERHRYWNLFHQSGIIFQIRCYGVANILYKIFAYLSFCRISLITIVLSVRIY